MIAPDTQLLLYAYDERSQFHLPAVAWLEGILNGVEPVGFPLPVLHAYLRLMTNPAIAGKGVSIETALADVDSWLEQPHVQLLTPGPRHWELLRDLAVKGQARAHLIPDAVIAAIALEYGAELHTHDRDFARFPGLRWKDPLAT